MRIALLPAIGVLLAAGSLAVIRYGTRRDALLAGGVLVLVGLPLLLLARLQLGSAFAVTPQAKALVKRGLYAKIPHPMYLFLDLTFLGVIVMSRRAWILVILAALVAAQVWQARREARVLGEAFGEAYRTYRKGTWW